MAAVYVDRPNFQFQIQIQDSCNWCCLKKATDEDAELYINHKGKAEPFDPKKAKDEEDRIQAMERSINHLTGKLDQMLELAKIDEERREPARLALKEKVEGVLLADPSPRPGIPRQITVAMVERVNEAIKEVLSASTE